MQNFKNTIKHLKLKNSWKNKAIGKMIFAPILVFGT